LRKKTKQATNKTSDQTWPLQFDSFCLQKYYEPIELDKFRVSSYETIHYVPDFITEEDERVIWGFVQGSSRWVQGSGIDSKFRRTQNWGGKPGNRSVEEELPTVFKKLVDAMVQTSVFPPEFRPNHVLVNEYKNGWGLIPHADGPLYYPRVATVSLGGSVMLSYWSTGKKMEDESFCDIFLRRRCLHVTSDDIYRNYLHGIRHGKNDVITEKCCNIETAKVNVGEEMERSELRISLVFVHKLQ